MADPAGSPVARDRRFLTRTATLTQSNPETDVVARTGRGPSTHRPSVRGLGPPPLVDLPDRRRTGHGPRDTEPFFVTPPEPRCVLSVELHAHSSRSYDGRDSVETLVEQAAAVGLDALAVTDHDEFDASRTAVELCGERDMIGIPGMEVSTAAGHVLGLGVRELIPAGLPFSETVDRIHEQGGIAVVPHPFQESRSGVLAHIDREELTRADAIEIYNSRLLTGRANRQAERFAHRNGMATVAGSDAHIAEMVGQAVTHIDANERSVGAILDAIREGRTTVEGKRTPWLVSFRQAAGGAKRRVKNRLLAMLD
jgi:predicted metal-dependent phosphoesterase TrpH